MPNEKPTLSKAFNVNNICIIAKIFFFENNIFVFFHKDSATYPTRKRIINNCSNPKEKFNLNNAFKTHNGGLSKSNKKPLPSGRRQGDISSRLVREIKKAHSR
jgi:hypothetical protein